MTCTLEQAKELKRLKAPQTARSLFTFYNDTDKHHVNRRETALKFYHRNKEKFGKNNNSNLVSAYDAEELFSFIKGSILIESEDGYIGANLNGIVSSGNSLAEALANLLIWQLNQQ
jgi:hypothetical protein